MVFHPQDSRRSAGWRGEAMRESIDCCEGNEIRKENPGSYMNDIKYIIPIWYPPSQEMIDHIKWVKDEKTSKKALDIVEKKIWVVV